MALKYVIRVDQFGIYNCGAAIFSNFSIRRVGEGAYAYAEPDYLAANKDEIIKEFLEYLGSPCTAKILPFPEKNWNGVIAHYKGPSTYTKIPFYMFHDNIKGDITGFDHPFSDGSSLLSYLYHNQEKYGVTITRSHMADNVYHTPSGSHPGRCYIITPPSIPSFVPGAKLPADVKKQLGGVVINYSTRIYKDDLKVLKDLADSK